MSMVAHGYGIAAFSSPNIIFSNIIWGYIVRLIPTFDGVLGYSTATFGVLIISGTAIFAGLMKLGAHPVKSALVLILIFTRPILFPQFTLNAGLLMVAAIICFHLYSRTTSLVALVIGCVLAYLSYLVRSQEFLLVLLVALPLLPWKLLKKTRAAKFALAITAFAIVLSAITDYKAYQSLDWQAYNQLNPARAHFTDFGAGQQLKNRPDILDEHNYSQNDINLITNWFFVDPDIANPGKLNSMLEKLGPLPIQSNSLTNAWIGVNTIIHPNLLPLIIAALILFVCCPSRKYLVTACLCLAAIFCLGLLGRPGVLRVYMPLASLLVIVPFLSTRKNNIWRERLALAAIFLIVAFNTYTVYAQSKAFEASSKQINQGLSDFPPQSLVVWGAGFPFEAAYAPLTPLASSLRLYGLGVFTLAPFSVASQDQKNGDGIIDLLKKGIAIPIVGTEQNFASLGKYCEEHLNRKLMPYKPQTIDQVQVTWIRCEAGSTLGINQQRTTNK
ncbi:hypothetical protein [Pseudomonas sp. NA-150]|uniref:hypothetical protein n=1 Tax=Pseudomonas sp. NA-150 TaxID=3367525 RepID=UPI0037CA10F1